MRIVAGAWRGRALVAPAGQGTRPTADRVRQALFDMLMHAEWGGRAAIEGAVVLDVFAGTGALGLEALSRGASSALFIESDPGALRALRANLVTCKARDRAQVFAVDVFGLSSASQPRHPPGSGATRARPVLHPTGPDGLPIRAGRTEPAAAMTEATGSGPASLVFLDPPYGQGLVPRALLHLQALGWIADNALIIGETGRDETWTPEQPVLAERQYGAARVLVFRRRLISSCAAGPERVRRYRTGSGSC